MSGAAQTRTVWPESLLRGALLTASESVLRLELGEPDPVTQLECSRVRSAIDRALAHIAESTLPLGSVLIVSAPECASDVVVEQVLAALLAGNRLAISHHGSLGRAARVALDALQRCSPPGVLRQFENEAFRLEWAHIAIVILTPTRVFLNETPWVSWQFDGSDSTAGTIDFYRRHHDAAHGGARHLLEPEFAG